MGLLTDGQKDKLFSGRYFLTLCAGTTLVYATWAKILPPEAVASIISVVIMAYFQRTDKNGEEKK